MASEVFSVKVSEELKDRIKTLIDESGLQGKEFMEEIIKAYELNTAKYIMPSAMGDIEELQAVTKRIYDIFIGLIERSSNLMKDREDTFKNGIEKKNRSITLVQEKLDTTLQENFRIATENENLNKKYQELKEEVSHSEERMQEQERNYRSLLESKDELIMEYKKKNDVLNGVISEYKEYKDKNKELATSMELLKKQVEEKERREEKLTAEIERISSQNEIAIQKAQMEKEKALLELRESYQSKNEELSNDYNANVDEYNKKIKALLDEIQRASNKYPD